MTTSRRSRRLTARLSPSSPIPKMARGSATARDHTPASGAGMPLLLEEQAPEHVAQGEEHEDDDGHDDRDEAHHLEEAGVLGLLVHSVAARRPAGRTRSETR